MGKGKRYKKSKKRLNNFLLFYLMIVTFMLSLYTFSRYTTTLEGAPEFSVAKFNVKVNGVSVGTGETFELNLSENENTYLNKLEPGNEGYFDIEINPSGTEVALNYEFKIEMNSIEGLSLVDYDYILNSGETLKKAFEGNSYIITGTMALPEEGNVRKAFTDKDKVNIRINWVWKNVDILNPTITNTNITVTATIKQKIN